MKEAGLHKKNCNCKFAIWGIGSRGHDAYHFLSDFRVSFFIDSNPSYWGKSLYGIEVISFDEFLAKDATDILIITPEQNESIIELLHRNHITRYIIFNFFYEDYQYTFDCYKNSWDIDVIRIYIYMQNQFIKSLNLMMNEDFLLSYNQGTIKSFNQKEAIETIKSVPKLLVVETEQNRFPEIECIRKKPIIYNRYSKEDIKADAIVIHGGIAYSYIVMRNTIYAKKNEIPLFITEDGFIRSVVPKKYQENVEQKYRLGHSLVLDQEGLYIKASVPSAIENVLNSDIRFSENELRRSRKIINYIMERKISKYNHQPIKIIDVNNNCRKRVLVIDQVVGDGSIKYGLATEETFNEMLLTAINKHPDADIYIKTHPEGSVKRGHYEYANSYNNVYKIDYEINPICLIESMDIIYVCSSTMGMEALLCNKEVHVFGMPFYAGWGVTHDRLSCARRVRKRSIEEIFYVAYIMCSVYVSYKRNEICEIEQAIEELIELRDEYWKSRA